MASRDNLIAYARRAARREGLDENIFVAQLQQESGFNPNAVSPAGAQGVAQIMPEYHPDVDPSDPYASIDHAARWMKQLLRRYDGDYRLALAAYNAGPGAVDKHNGVPPFAETQAYVQKILGGRSPHNQQSQGRTPGLAAPMRDQDFMWEEGGAQYPPQGPRPVGEVRADTAPQTTTTSSGSSGGSGGVSAQDFLKFQQRHGGVIGTRDMLGGMQAEEAKALGQSIPTQFTFADGTQVIAQWNQKSKLWQIVDPGTAWKQDEKANDPIRHSGEKSIYETDPATGQTRPIYNAPPKDAEEAGYRYVTRSDGSVIAVRVRPGQDGQKPSVEQVDVLGADPMKEIQRLRDEAREQDQALREEARRLLETNRLKLDEAKFWYQQQRDRLEHELAVRTQEITQRGQDVNQRGQDIAAQTAVRGQDLDYGSNISRNAVSAVNAALPFMAPAGTQADINAAIGSIGRGLAPAPTAAPQPMPYNPFTYAQQVAKEAISDIEGMPNGQFRLPPPIAPVGPAPSGYIPNVSPQLQYPAPVPVRPPSGYTAPPVLTSGGSGMIGYTP